MNQVVLTVGPQHIGKSTFCNKIIALDPTITMVSRDAILTELFDSPYLDSYSDGHHVALEKMWERLSTHLQHDGTTTILDCWNGPDTERQAIVKNIRALGVEIVGAWYFITPFETCVEWRIQESLLKKPPKDLFWKEIRINSIRQELKEYYDWFYENATVDQSLGFDFVKRINPLEPFTLSSLFAI